MKKFFILLIVMIVLLIGVIVSIPIFFKDDINKLVKEQINDELLVSVDYGDYDVAIVKSFPDLQFSLKDLVVVGQDRFEGDTLALMKELTFDLDAKKMYFEKALDIHSLYINSLNLKTYLLSDSSNSIDVLKDKLSTENNIDTTSESLININLSSLIVENSNIYYKNEINLQEVLLEDINIDAKIGYIDEKASIDAKSAIGGIYYHANKQGVQLSDLDMDISADYLDKFSNIETVTKATSLTFEQDGTKYIHNTRVALDGIIKADFGKNMYHFDKNNIKLNDLAVAYFGRVILNKHSKEYDLSFQTNERKFKEILSLIPEKYLKNYEDIDVKGDLSLRGGVKGIQTKNKLPSFDLNLDVENGFFKYPSLPTALENIDFKASLNSSNSNQGQVDLIIPKANFTVENEPIDMSISILDIQDKKELDVKAKGKLALNKIPEFYPIENIDKINGEIDMDVFFKGEMESLKQKDFQNIDFQGDMAVKDLEYKSKSMAFPINVKTMDLDFSPKYVNMSNTDLKYGNTDIKAQGKLENVLDYLLADGTVKGNLDIKSNKIDLTEIMGESSKKDSKKDENSQATKIPKNVNFIMNADVNELTYKNIELDKLKGKVIMSNEKVNVKSVGANMLGGKAKINGVYSTKNTEKPLIDFKYNINNFDIQQTFDKVNTIKQIAPIAKYLTGNFNSTFSFNSLLEDDYKPDMNMFQGLGDVNITNASFLNFPLLKSVNNAVKLPILDLDKATIKNASTIFKIKNGKVEVEPFEYSYEDIKMKIAGSNGFDKSIDYALALTVPSDKFGNASKVANDFLKLQNIPLLNLAIPKDITFHLKVSGFLDKPKVKIVRVSSNNSDKGIVEQVAEDLKDKLQKELERKAKEEAARLKKELEKRLKKEAEDKLKKEGGKVIDDILKGKLPNFGF